MLTAYFVDDTQRTAWVSHVLVHSAHRGLGIGRALWERFWSDIENRAVDSVGLNVEPELPVRRLYETRMTEIKGPAQRLWDRLYWTGHITTDSVKSIQVSIFEMKQNSVEIYEFECTNIFARIYCNYLEKEQIL